MSTLKLLHQLLALISISGFILRGVWMLRGSARLNARWVRIAPHAVDALLLGAGVWLMIATHQYPPQQTWLSVKLVAIVVYIALGMVALRRGRTRLQRAAAFVAAVAVFAYIAAVAFTRSAVLGLA